MENFVAGSDFGLHLVDLSLTTSGGDDIAEEGTWRDKRKSSMTERHFQPGHVEIPINFENIDDIFQSVIV